MLEINYAEYSDKELAEDVLVRFIINNPNVRGHESGVNTSELHSSLRNISYHVGDFSGSKGARKYAEDFVKEKYNVSVGRQRNSGSVKCGIICVRLANNELQFVKLASSKKGSYIIYDIPKGKKCHGETSLEAGLRETIEEIGIDVSRYVWPAELCNDGDKVIYVAMLPDNINEFTPLTRGEVGSIVWAPINELASVVFLGDIPDIVAQVESFVRMFMLAN